MLNFMKKKTQKDIVNDLKLIDSTTPFAIREAYKSLYTNILYLNIEDKCKKIVITSALPGEGKSCLSANLACTFAQNSEDKKILLIDADMRAPKAAKLFSMEGRPNGLSEYLAGIDEKPALRYLPEHKLTILTSGGFTVNPTKLISSHKMAELIKSLEDEFDYIFIDTPPVTIVTDAVLLSDFVNGYIISTLADRSDVKSLDETIGLLNQVGAEIFGTVLSALKLKDMGGKYGKYGKYDKYDKYDSAVQALGEEK